MMLTLPEQIWPCMFQFTAVSVIVLAQISFLNLGLSRHVKLQLLLILQQIETGIPKR